MIAAIDALELTEHAELSKIDQDIRKAASEGRVCLEVYNLYEAPHVCELLEQNGFTITRSDTKATIHWRLGLQLLTEYDVAACTQVKVRSDEW